MDEEFIGKARAFKKKFDSEALKADKIFITCHIGPDDDAIGSLLAAYHYVTNNLGVPEGKVKCVYSGSKSERYSYFEGYENVIFAKDIAGHVKDGFVLFLDGSQWRRFSGEEKPSLAFSACIDHHPGKADEHDLSIIVPGFSSTAELLYHVFFMDEKSVEKNVCEALLLGIIGDTGKFSFVSKENKSVFGVAERLVEEANINIQEFESKYDFVLDKSYMLFKELVSNSKVGRRGDWPRFLYSYIDNASVDVNVMKEAAQMFISYIRKVKNVGWGFVVTPRNGHCSVSLRALPGSVNVGKVAEAFGGGGHELASGCGFEDIACKDAKQLLLEWLEDNSYEDYRHRP